MKSLAIIAFFSIVMETTPISQTYTTSQSFGSSYSGDGTGKPEGKAWGNSYGLNSVTDPEGYTYKNEAGNNYFTPLDRVQVGQLYQKNQDNVANLKAAFQQRFRPILVYPAPQPAPKY